MGLGSKVPLLSDQHYVNNLPAWVHTRRSRALVWIAFMMTSVVTMSIIAPTLDIYGHLGGALAGSRLLAPVAKLAVFWSILQTFGGLVLG